MQESSYISECSANDRADNKVHLSHSFVFSKVSPVFVKNIQEVDTDEDCCGGLEKLYGRESGR